MNYFGLFNLATLWALSVLALSILVTPVGSGLGLDRRFGEMTVTMQE